jgi:salicylate hydroxylase
MRDMAPLKTWVSGRTIIIGDAAHPSTSPNFFDVGRIDTVLVLPHQAGGALSGIEDAEGLGTFLRGVTRDGVHNALQRVFRLRFKRASRYQLLSRVEGIKKGAPPTHEEVVRAWDYPGAARWEVERPDMVLREGEDVIYALEN